MVFTPRPLRTGEGNRKFGPALTIGTNMAVGVAVFSFLGYKAGERMGSRDVGTLAGVLLGLAYGAYEVWKVVRSLQADETDTGEK